MWHSGYYLSFAKIVGRSMWAIWAGGQEARFSLALTMGCSIDYGVILPSCAVGLDSVSSFVYREPKGETVHVFV